MTIGSYLKIADDDGLSIIAVVKSFRLQSQSSEQANSGTLSTSFVLQAQPVGFLDEIGTFKRGGQQIVVPPTHVEIASESILRAIYQPNDPSRSYSFGFLAQDANIPVMINADRFFGKHVAVVGATGSGKSFAASSLLQSAQKYEPLPFIFDLGGNYETLTRAFGGSYLNVGLKNPGFSINPFSLKPSDRPRRFYTNLDVSLRPKPVL